MEKAFQIQQQVRDNAKTLQSYMTDLQNWEFEMKRKEAALNGDFEQNLPPVRSKIKKEKPVVVKKKPEEKIRSYDYSAWDKFDVDKACEDVDMAEIGPTSLDGKKSQSVKQEKLREEAQYEKERASFAKKWPGCLTIHQSYNVEDNKFILTRYIHSFLMKGNTFVKQEKWDEAIACYNRAIELIKDDAIYYANRGLCYLKKDSLHQAESDCTEALRLDPTYVKALQRRATARERLGSLRAASHDLTEVLNIEPHNNAAKKQLDTIKARMGTKGSKSKSSPSSTPTVESKLLPVAKAKAQPKIIEMPPEAKIEVRPLANWQDGGGENVTVIKPVKKPPHMRSKRPLKTIPIHEIQLGKTTPEKPPTRIKIIEIEDEKAHGDSNNNSNKIDNSTPIDSTGDFESNEGKIVELENNDKLDNDNAKLESKTVSSPESVKLITDSVVTEKNLVQPVNSVQFMGEWKYLKGNDSARSDYLSIIEPSKIPSIFANALESDVLSEVVRVLHDYADKFKDKKVADYLTALGSVKRFSALAMFLSGTDKQLLTKLLEHCKTAENCTEQEISDLKNKYEL